MAEMPSKLRVFKYISEETEESLVRAQELVGKDFLNFLRQSDLKADLVIKDMELERDAKLKIIMQRCHDEIEKLPQDVLDMDFQETLNIDEIEEIDPIQKASELIKSTITPQMLETAKTPAHKTRSTISVLATTVKKPIRTRAQSKFSSTKLSTAVKVQTHSEYQRLVSSVSSNGAKMVEIPLSTRPAKSREAILTLGTTGNSLASVVQKATTPTVFSVIVADGKMSVVGVADIL